MSASNETSILKRVKNSGLGLSMAKATSLAFHKVAPNWASKKVEDLLLLPKSKKVDKARIPHGIHLFQIDTPQGAVQAYQLGQGPTVLLVHGWGGGASTFFPLMRGLSQCGFKALAFDHLGHGHSESNQASLLHFISSTNAVLNHVRRRSTDGLAAVVSHSMGCIAAANCDAKFIRDIPLMLISPIYDFKAYITRQVNLLGLHPRVCKQYLDRLEQNRELDLDKIDIRKKLIPYASDIVIVHDKTDEESHYLDSVKLASAHPLMKLLLTKGQGHDLVINSESLWQQLKSHLNYEDITANRF